MSLEWDREWFSPKKAATLLGVTRQHFNNRPVTPANVAKIANDMRNGRFMTDTSEVIAISGMNGTRKVLNGQHRLEAVIEAARLDNSFKGVHMWVCSGVDESAFRFIDQGKPRDVADILAIETDWKHVGLFASAGRDLWRWLEHGHPYAKVERDETMAEGNIAAYITRNLHDLPTMRENLGLRPLTAKRGDINLLTEGVLLTCGYYWSLEDSAEAIRWIQHIINPEDVELPCANLRYALTYLRKLKAAMEDMEGRNMPRARHFNWRAKQFEALHTAWRAYREGKIYRGNKGSPNVSTGFNKDLKTGKYFP